MRDRQTPSLQDALRDERRRLVGRSYPGDLAADVLESGTGRGWCRPAAWAAFALIAFGSVVTIGLTINRPNDANTLADHEAGTSEPQPAPAPAPETDQTPDPAPPPTQFAEQADPTPPSPGPGAYAQQTASAPATIDASLVPFYRVNGQVRLSRPGTPQLPIAIANRRGHLSFTAPSRGSIDRLMRRTLQLSPTPTPERTTS